MARLFPTLLAGIAVLFPGPVLAQTASKGAPATDDSDLLTPLVAAKPVEDDDLLTPLVPQKPASNADDDLLTPLVPRKPAPKPASADDDLLTPLVPQKPAATLDCNAVLASPPKVMTVDGVELAPVVKAKVKHKDDDLLAPLVPSTHADYDACRKKVDDDIRKKSKPVAKRVAIKGYHEVKHFDPCYTYYVHWSGKKDCYPGTWSSWEAGSGDGGSPPDGAGDPPPPPTPPPPPPSDESGTPPLDTGGAPLKGGAPGGPGPGDGPGAAPGAPSGAPGGSPGGSPRGPVPNPGGGAKGGVAAPIPDGLTGRWQRLDTFAARLESATLDGRGRVDAIVSLRNETRKAQLVSRGDWTAMVADADGLAKQDGQIWTPNEGPPRNFDQMPIVAPGLTVRVRFVVDPADVRTTLARLELHQTAGAPAAFSLVGVDPGGNRDAPAVAASVAPFTTGGWFDLRVDGARSAGDRTELFFTARNRTGRIRYADGAALRVAAANGVPTDGAAYSIRGRRGVQTGMVPVGPGEEVRLRVAFVGAAKGPWTFDDGQARVTVATPPAGATASAKEPVW